MVCFKRLLSLGIASFVLGLSANVFAAVNWVPTSSPTPLAFETAANWEPSVYESPPPTPELTPPGSDSIWFLDEYDGSVVISQPRTAATTKLGPGRIGGGDANQVTTLYVDADVTITGQERDATGAVNPNLREMRIDGDDLTPGDSNFPLGRVIQRAGHVNLEYATDPADSDLKIVSDKLVTGGGVWEVGGTAQLTVLDSLLIGEKTGVVATGGIFRVRGSQVQGVYVGDRFLALSRSAHWDLTQIDYGGGNVQQQANRGKSIIEFVLDEGGVTPITVDGDIALGSEYVDINSLTAYVVPGFLRVKISEPTMVGSGVVGSGNEEVLIVADNIGSRVTSFPGTQSAAGVFYDPDRILPNFPHRVISRQDIAGTAGTVISQYAGVTYTWTAVYDDNSLGLGVLENAFTLTDLVISDPGGSGIHGDFDNANGLDANDADALQTAFGTSIGFADAQHMFDLNADGAIDRLDLIQLVTHAGFADTSMADFNLDGLTNGQDLAIWQSGYGMGSGALFTDGDTDLDGDIDGRDFLTWQRNFEAAVAAVSAVPEPTSLVLLGALALPLLGRSRR